MRIIMERTKFDIQGESTVRFNLQNILNLKVVSKFLVDFYGRLDIPNIIARILDINFLGNLLSNWTCKFEIGNDFWRGIYSISL